MAIFCTKCGTKNEDGAAFCDNCGAALKAPAVAQTPGNTPHTPYAQPTPTMAYEDTGAAAAEKLKGLVTSKKAIYSGAALCGLLVIGGAATYFVLQPPAATSGNLLAAAKAGYGKAITEQFKRELCVGNMDYSDSKFNAGEDDQRTQAWLNALVVAGLYSPPVTINSGGFFSRNLLQYAATPELAKYREGGRLCVGKEVEIADVVDIEKPAEESLGRDSGAPRLLTVKARLALEVTNTAPWLEKSEVRDVVLAQINGWDYKDKKLQKQVADTFGLREKQWATGPAYKAELEKQYRTGKRGQDYNDRTNNVSQKAGSSSFGSMLSGIFSFGGHPLKGTWRMDTEGLGKSFGIGLPSGLGLDATTTFTSNSIDVGGQSIKCKFEVDGKRVKVIPEGQAASLIFVMLDKDTAVLDMGLMKMQYKRVD